MYKFLLTPPGMFIAVIALLFITGLMVKLFGASFYLVACIAIVFLILLAAYLVLNVMEETLLTVIAD
jgi:hypothetical protein